MAQPTDTDHQDQDDDNDQAHDQDHDHTTRIVTKGGKIHIELPDAKGGLRKSRTLVVESADEVVDGFVSFLREKAVVGLAVGFVIGTQAQGLIKELVASFIDPLFTLLFGKALIHQEFTLHFHGRSADFAWGSFAYVLMNFLFVIIAIYLIIKFFKLDRLDKQEGEAEKSQNEAEAKK